MKKEINCPAGSDAGGIREKGGLMKRKLTREEKRRIKARRLPFLVRLAGENPERFAVEWEREIGFWLQEIHDEAANGLMTGRSVFGIVREAKATLALCGQRAVRDHGKRTMDILNNECCRMIAPMMGAGSYRMNAYIG